FQVPVPRPLAAGCQPAHALSAFPAHRRHRGHRSYSFCARPTSPSLSEPVLCNRYPPLVPDREERIRNWKPHRPSPPQPLPFARFVASPPESTVLDLHSYLRTQIARSFPDPLRFVPQSSCLQDQFLRKYAYSLGPISFQFSALCSQSQFRDWPFFLT